MINEVSKSFVLLFILFVVFTIMPVHSAYAYLDPGFASITMQGIVAAFAAAAGAIYTLRQRLYAVFNWLRRLIIKH
jgi:uncharacterized membrane protein